MQAHENHYIKRAGVAGLRARANVLDLQIGIAKIAIVELSSG